MVYQRFRADSNRCRRFCRPLPSHSATKPFDADKKTGLKSMIGNLKRLFFFSAAKIGYF